MLLPGQPLYLSRLLGSRVVERDGVRIGWVADVVARPGGLFPVVVGLLVRRPGARMLRVPWECLDRVSEGSVALAGPVAEVAPLEVQEGDILLGAEVLDKQLVDMHGRRVVKVNDLRLIPVRGDLRVVGVDVGIRGILRRLGMEDATERFAGLMRRSLPEALIPWNYVESVPTRGASVRLSVESSRLERLPPADISRIISQLSEEDRAAAVEQLSDEAIAAAMAELDAPLQLSLMEGMDNARASDILERMAPDEATDLLQELPEERQAELLTLMEREEAAELAELMQYDEHTAGGLMTTQFIAIPSHFTASEAIAQLREMAPGAETIYYLYVLDADGRLMGVLSLFRLITCAPDRPISEVMDTAVISVPANLDQEEVAATMVKYHLLALPVVGDRGELLGIVTVDDTIDVMDEEAEEDVAHIAGTPAESPEERQRPAAVALTRAPWLLLALTAGLLAASTLHRVAGTALSQAIGFLPLALLLGNQIAARAAAATARGLALREVDRDTWWSHSLAELRGSAVIALVTGFLSAAIAGLWGGGLLGAVVGCSLVCVVLSASVIGLSIPLLEASVRLDPAVALRPIVISILAVMAPAIYAGFASLFLR